MIEPRRLLLIDEPSKGLAPAIVGNLIEALRELKRMQDDGAAGRAELQHGALRSGDTVAVMDDGRVVHRGAMAELAHDEVDAAAAPWPVAGSASMNTVVAHAGSAVGCDPPKTRFDWIPLRDRRGARQSPALPLIGRPVDLAHVDGRRASAMGMIVFINRGRASRSYSG